MIVLHAGHYLPHLPLPVPTLGMGVLLTLILVAIVVLPRFSAAPASLPAFDFTTTRRVLDQFARSSIDPFALMADKAHFWSSDGAAFLAYGARAGIAVVAGAGIGPPDSVQTLRQEFESACRDRGLRPAYFQVGAEAPADGMRVAAGEEALVNLRGWSLGGSRMARLRHDTARGLRHGVQAEVRPAGQLELQTRRELDCLARLCADGRRPKLAAFSFGSPDLRPATETLVGLARDAEGGLVAAATCLVLPAGRRAVIDRIDRRPDAPPGAVEVLLSACLGELSTVVDEASLGLVPPAGWEWPIRLLSRAGLCTAAPGQRLFKSKFRPRWEPRYLVVRSVLDLPAAVIALFLVHHRPRRQGGLVKVLTAAAHDRS